jgi:gamma-glutamylcyclotransferase (GGCT)/AIG2-like uncharacterized protein YtfP
MSPQLLFVYGLLMRGFSLHELLRAAEFVDTATTRGTLLSLGSYPGLVDGGGEVQGELYLLNDPAAILPAIDAAEEVDPQNGTDGLYQRVARDVWSAKTGRVRSWVYLYNAGRGEEGARL